MFINFIDFSNAQHIALLTSTITALITLTTLFFTIKNNKSNNFVNSVNRERIDSLNNLKLYVSEFNSHIYSIIYEDTSLRTSELIKLKNLIEFQLNPNRLSELLIITHINKVIKLVEVSNSIEKYSKIELFIFIKELQIDDFQNLIYLNNKQFLKSILKIEQAKFENAIAIQIKNEWSKIKKDSKS